MTQQTETIIEQDQKTSSRTWIRVTGAGIVLIALVAIGTIPRLARQREALAAVQESPVTHPIVTLVHPKKGEPVSELLLPGNIQPLYSATVYARTDGYVERRNVDIGSKVRAGEILAVISSPEVDQQLLQARATLAQSQASLNRQRHRWSRQRRMQNSLDSPKSATFPSGRNTLSRSRSLTRQYRLTTHAWPMSPPPQQISPPLRPTSSQTRPM